MLSSVVNSSVMYRPVDVTGLKTLPQNLPIDGENAVLLPSNNSNTSKEHLNLRKGRKGRQEIVENIKIILLSGQQTF